MVAGKWANRKEMVIFLYEDPKEIRKKVMRAVTDAGPTEMNSAKPEPHSKPVHTDENRFGSNSCKNNTKKRMPVAKSVTAT